MADLSIFSARLKSACIMMGFSIDDLCASMGNIASKMTISKYENGQLTPNSSCQRYRTFCIQTNKVARFKALIERTLYHPEESTRFVSLVYKALSKELITISKAASLLHQDIEQVRSDLALV